MTTFELVALAFGTITIGTLIALLLLLKFGSSLMWG